MVRGTKAAFGRLGRRMEITKIARKRVRLVGKIGSHAQPALTEAQRKSRAKTNRRNARFAHTEPLRANGYKGPNISRSKLVKRLNRPVFLGQVGPARWIGTARSVQNIPRPAVVATSDAIVERAGIPVMIEYKTNQ